MDPSPHDPYEVTDLYAAAALVAAGFHLASVEPDARGARPTRFLFAPDDRLAETLKQHHSRALTVNSGLYAAAIRKLRTWSPGEPARPAPPLQHFGRRPASRGQNGAAER
jgi:hypothetical protein